MRLKDAIASLQLGRKKEAEIRQLCTVWSEQADDRPGTVPTPDAWPTGCAFRPRCAEARPECATDRYPCRFADGAGKES